MVFIARLPMPEPRGAVPLSCNPLFLRHESKISEVLTPDPSPSRAREARGRFAKGTSGNPRGIRNPKRRLRDLVARPSSAPAVSDLLDRQSHLLQPLAARLLPPPLALRRSVSGSICRRPTPPRTSAKQEVRFSRSRLNGRCRLRKRSSAANNQAT
jgi:hypothetical protein